MPGLMIIIDQIMFRKWSIS